MGKRGPWEVMECLLPLMPTWAFSMYLFLWLLLSGILYSNDKYIQSIFLSSMSCTSEYQGWRSGESWIYSWVVQKYHPIYIIWHEGSLMGLNPQAMRSLTLGSYFENWITGHSADVQRIERNCFRINVGKRHHTFGIRKNPRVPFLTSVDNFRLSSTCLSWLPLHPKHLARCLARINP